MFDRVSASPAIATSAPATTVPAPRTRRASVGLRRVLARVFSVRCAGCDAPGAPICRTCRFALLASPPQRPGVLVAVPFTGRARRVVLGFKFHNRRAVAGHLAGLVRRRLEQVGVRPGIDIDVVTWAPTGDARRRERGFDQAELIARHLARQLGLPCRRLLIREESAGPQSGRSRAERLRAPGFRARLDRPGRSVLLVDDVATTGATLGSASAALRSVGARDVLSVAVAGTPVRTRRRPNGHRRPLRQAA